MQSGDLVFCHSKGPISRAIRCAEWVRFRKGSTWTHVAILDKQWPNGRWTVIQAESNGVTAGKTLDSLSAKGSAVVVLSPAHLRMQQLAFARDQVGERYGFLTILSVLVTLFLPRFINVMLPNTWICSALAAESLRAGGWVHCWPDVYQVSPAELWEVLLEERKSEALGKVAA